MIKLTEEQRETYLGHGLRYQTVYQRIKSGWAVEKAITTKVPKNKSRLLNRGYMIIKGHKITSEELEKSPVSVATIRRRLYLGWDLETSLNEQPNGDLVVGGVSIPRVKVQSAQRKLGIQTPTIIARLERGWSVDDALTKPLQGTMTEREELIMALGRMKYCNRVYDDTYNPVPLMTKLKVTWNDIEEVKC